MKSARTCNKVVNKIVELCLEKLKKEKKHNLLKPLINDVIFFLFSENSKASYSYHMCPQRTVENNHIQI